MSVTLRPEELARLTELRTAARENPVLRAVTDVLHGNGLPTGINAVLSALGLKTAVVGAAPQKHIPRQTFNV